MQVGQAVFVTKLSEAKTLRMNCMFILEDAQALTTLHGHCPSASTLLLCYDLLTQVPSESDSQLHAQDDLGVRQCVLRVKVTVKQSPHK